MKKTCAVAFALLSGCASVGHRNTVTPPPDYRAICDHYIEGFGRFYTIEARIKKEPLTDPAGARNLLGYLESRPRREERERVARNRDRLILKYAKRGQPKIAETLADFLSLSRECDYGNVPYGWTTLVENRKQYGFTAPEKKNLRAEVLRYLRDNESVVMDLASVSIRVTLADAAVRAKFLKLKKPAKRKLAALKNEVDSISSGSRLLMAQDTDARVKSTVEDVARTARLMERLRRILPSR